MKNEKREFIKKFDVAIEDLLDNYEKYTDEEKAQFAAFLTRAIENMGGNPCQHKPKEEKGQ